MAVGQAQHCLICGSPAMVMEENQTLCIPCHALQYNEEGEPISEDCPECGTEAGVTLRESGFKVCTTCWWDEDTRDPEELWL